MHRLCALRLRPALTRLTSSEHAVGLVSALLVRGGGDNASLQAIPNIDRTLIRLDAVNTYPVIAAFLMSITIDVSHETPKEIKPFPRDGTKRVKAGVLIHNVLTVLYSILSTLTVSTFAYSIIVFTIIIIYSKNALGEGNDEAFLEFYNATMTYREYYTDSSSAIKTHIDFDEGIRAFRAFFHGVIGTCFSNTLSKWLRYRGIIRWIETSLMFVLSCFTALQLESIIELATDLVFRRSIR